MKRLGKGASFPYVPAVERVRLRMSADKTIPLTTFHLKPMSAWDALRWDAFQAYESNDGRGQADLANNVKAKRMVEVDTDAIVAHIERIENVETETGYETLSDAVAIRAFLEDPVFQEDVRRELWAVVKDHSLLRLGEPGRLRSLSTSSSGEVRSPSASDSLTAGSALGPALGGSSEASVSETVTEP